MIELLTQLLELPNSWVIFDIESDNHEAWLFLKKKEISLSDEIKTETLRHLEIFGKKAYIKLHFTNDKDLNELKFYTTIGFCVPFIMDVKKMIGKSTDASICKLYDLTMKELNKIKES